MVETSRLVEEGEEESPMMAEQRKEAAVLLWTRRRWATADSTRPT